MSADQGATEAPQVFERVGRAQLAGCIAYLLLVPAFVIVAGLIAGVLGAGISQLLKLGETPSVVLSLTLAGVSMIAAGCFGVRNYRSRAGARVEVAADYIESTGDLKPRRIRYDDLEWIQAYGAAILKLGAKGGVRLDLRSEEWPIEKIHQALLVRAVPLIAARCRDRVLDGKDVVFETPLRQVATMVVVGAVLLLVAGMAGTQYVRMAARGETKYSKVGQAGLVLAFVAGGLGSIYRGFADRKGYVVTERGIRIQGRPDSERPWSALREGRETSATLLLHFDDGKKPIRISSLRRNHGVMVALVKSLTAEEAWNQQITG